MYDGGEPITNMVELQQNMVDLFQKSQEKRAKLELLTKDLATKYKTLAEDKANKHFIKQAVKKVKANK